MTCEPIVAIAIDTAHQVVTLMAIGTRPPFSTNASTMSGVIATTEAMSVRRIELGTMIARAITVFAQASRPE